MVDHPSYITRVTCRNGNDALARIPTTDLTAVKARVFQTEDQQCYLAQLEFIFNPNWYVVLQVEYSDTYIDSLSFVIKKA